ncbi:Hypothetical predicted protein [Mytilus galloprovincialis]|uniref:Uncharacterized protein n=1 Tax=Mytilus galloprovincialis TaxID=29158 RepID=A0A8B6FAQ1_MYTGA|nr:Hypothetical predicted protein [Mytilus galloprovincialis]
MILSDINTILTSFSEHSADWEQGENHFFHINPGTNRYTVRIPFGCPTTITLPVEDPDGDNLQAREANPDECGGACTSLPKFILKPTLGQLIIDATTKNGYKADELYRVTLMIEDYPTYTIKIGNDTVTPRHSISKIPLQFTVKVIDNPSSCDNTDMTFAYPTLDDGQRISYPGFIKYGKFRNGVYVESKLSNSVEFMASLPAGMQVELLKDDKFRKNVSRIFISWNPPREQSADNIMCVWGKRDNGITSDTRCVVGLINDTEQHHKNSETWPLVIASVCGATALVGATACCWWCLCGAAVNRRKRKRIHPKPRSVEKNGVAHNNVSSIRKSIDILQGAK